MKSQSRRQVQPRARHKLIRSGTAAVAAAIVFGAMGVRTALAQEYSWREAVSGNWMDSNRWRNTMPPNNAGIPDAPGESAYIGVISLTGGTYSVTLNSSIDIAGLAFSSNHGTLALGAAGGAPITIKAGYLTLDGRAVVVNGDTAFQVPFSSHLVNKAPITVNAGAQLTFTDTRVPPDPFSPPPTPYDFVHTMDSSLTLNGPLRLEKLGFRNEGGALVGDAPILLYGSSVTQALPTSSFEPATGTFVFRTSGSFGSTTDWEQKVIRPGQTVIAQANNESIEGNNIMLALPGDGPGSDGFVNRGTLIVESVGGDYGVTVDTFRGMFNYGTIVVRGGGAREFRRSLYNYGNATATFDADTTVNEVLNAGTMTVAAGKTLTINDTSTTTPSFTVSGTLNLLGDLRFQNNAGELVYNNGAITGRPIHLYGTKLTFGPNLTAGQGEFVIHQPTAGLVQTVSGRIPRGVSVRVEAGPFHLSTASNAGSLVIEGNPEAPFRIEAGVTNSGTLRLAGTTTPRWPPPVNTGWQVGGNLLNDTRGDATIATHTIVQGDVTNRALLTIGPDALLRVDGGNFLQEAGTLDVHGALSLSGVATFQFKGGTITGNAIGASDLTLDYTASGPASGSFVVDKSFRGGVPAGMTVTVRPSTSGTVSGNYNWSVGGTLLVEGATTLTSSVREFGSEDRRITNTGVIRFEKNPQVSRTINAELINTATGSVTLAARTHAARRISNSGTLTIADGVNVTAGGGIDNTGTVTIGAGATLTLWDAFTQQGTLTMAPTAKLDVGLRELRRTLADAAAAEAQLHDYERLIASARNAPSGKWKGPGITSSSATAANRTVAAGYVNPSKTGVLVRYSYDGDANVDGIVNADDYFNIDSGFLGQAADPLFAQGDFNYDDKVNADDYFLIDSAFLGQGAPLSGTGDSSVRSVTAVPEPASLAVVALGAAGLLARPSAPRHRKTHA